MLTKWRRFPVIFAPERGFTLIELLIVIVIIGILAVIVVPGLASGPARSRDGKRKADLHSLKLALEGYYIEHANAYPNVAGANSYAAFGNLGTPLTGYVQGSLPVDPKNSGVFQYQYVQKDATASSAQAIACLENTKDSGVGTTTATYATPAAAQACTGGVLYDIQTNN